VPPSRGPFLSLICRFWGPFGGPQTLIGSSPLPVPAPEIRADKRWGRARILRRSNQSAESLKRYVSVELGENEMKGTIRYAVMPETRFYEALVGWAAVGLGEGEEKLLLCREVTSASFRASEIPVVLTLQVALFEH